MTSCTFGNGMRVATEDFKLVLPAAQLPLGSLVPTCKGRVIALSGQNLSDGAVLYWRLEADTLAAVLEGYGAVVVRLGEYDECADRAVRTTTNC